MVLPLISIIIPTYYRRDLLISRSLPSALAQTHSQIEVLVVGDGTDQGTCDDVMVLASEDSRVQFWNLPHAQYPSDTVERWQVLGIEALNFGLDQARGEWVAALGDDDWLECDM